MIITSSDNKEIKRVSKLNSKKYRELEKEFIVGFIKKNIFIRK